MTLVPYKQTCDVSCSYLKSAARHASRLRIGLAEPKHHPSGGVRELNHALDRGDVRVRMRARWSHFGAAAGQAANGRCACWRRGGILDGPSDRRHRAFAGILAFEPSTKDVPLCSSRVAQEYLDGADDLNREVQPLDIFQNRPYLMFEIDILQPLIFATSLSIF